MKLVSLESDLSVSARKAQPPESLWHSPKCVLGRLTGKHVEVPPYPLRAPGVGRDELKALYGEPDQPD